MDGDDRRIRVFVRRGRVLNLRGEPDLSVSMPPCERIAICSRGANRMTSRHGKLPEKLGPRNPGRIFGVLPGVVSATTPLTTGMNRRRFAPPRR